MKHVIIDTKRYVIDKKYLNTLGDSLVVSLRAYNGTSKSGCYKNLNGTLTGTLQAWYELDDEARTVTAYFK